jgi:HEAT repeat protein
MGDLNPPGTQELVSKRLRFVLDEAAKPEAMKDKYLHSSPLGDFHNLVCQIEPKEKRLPFVREGIAHPHRAVRWSAYLFWLDRLPPDEAITAALKGLSDEDESVRQQAAEAFEKEMGSKQHVPALKKRLSAEKDERTRASLKKAIERLQSL